MRVERELAAWSASDSPPLPAWIGRLAAALAGNDGKVCTSVGEALRRAGRLPAGEPAAAAVLIAIVEYADGTGMLFTRRRDDLAAHPGQVAFPGGAGEGSETAEETALREAGEETALAPDEVRILGRLPDYPTTSGYLVTPVVGYVPALPPLRAQPEEVAEIFVVPVSILLDPTHWLNNPLRLGNERLPHRELVWRGQRIWGATAGMLQLLLPALTEAWAQRS